MLNIENNKSSTQQIITLEGTLSGMEALQFRDKTTTLIEIEEGQLFLDLAKVNAIDLTGFNSVVMLKKEALIRNLRLLIIANTNHPIHEYIHLSKLSFNCINSQPA